MELFEHTFWGFFGVISKVCALGEVATTYPLLVYGGTFRRAQAENGLQGAPGIGRFKYAFEVDGRAV